MKIDRIGEIREMVDCAIVSSASSNDVKALLIFVFIEFMI